MKQKHIISIMTGFLAVSAALIIGLANANITTERKTKSMTHAQKLDTNDDGAISLEELTALHKSRIAELDRDEKKVIEKLDRNGDGILRGNELQGHRFGGKKHRHNDAVLGSSTNS